MLQWILSTVWCSTFLKHENELYPETQNAMIFLDLNKALDFASKVCKHGFTHTPSSCSIIQAEG